MSSVSEIERNVAIELYDPIPVDKGDLLGFTAYFDEERAGIPFSIEKVSYSSTWVS